MDAFEAQELGRLAIALAREGGELAAERRRGVIEVAATKSSAADPVTAVDREVEELLRRRIAEARPNDAILGEEGDDKPGTSGYTWVLDPIDGTVNYLYDQPAWGVSVAVCTGHPHPTEWTVVAGAVAAPALGHLWHAWQGGGAFLDGEPIRVNEVEDLEVALVATGFGYLAEQRAEQGRIFAGVIEHVRDIRRLGSCAVDLCMVADGTLDAFFESGINAWDMAAGEVIIREAGGDVSGLGGERASEKMLLAGNPVIAGKLARVVGSAGNAQSGSV